MALNRRSGMDPRWAFYGRDTLAGFMPAVCTVFASTLKTGLTWDPFNIDPNLRKPGQSNTNNKIYVGPCRVTQNTGFRTRKGQDVDQDVSDQAVSIQLALNGNTLQGFDSPDSWLPIYPGSLVTVTKSFSLEGRAVSNSVTQYDYYVRIVNEASARMTKDLVCDLIPNARGGPRGNIG